MKCWEQYLERDYYNTYCSFCGIEMINGEGTISKRKKIFICHCPECYQIDYGNIYNNRKTEDDLMEPCYDLEGRFINH